jgi:hypothetical protein
LPWEKKVFQFITDRAAAMIVENNGVVCRQEQESEKNFFSLHCILHQTLCAKFKDDLYKGQCCKIVILFKQDPLTTDSVKLLGETDSKHGEIINAFM